MKIHTIGAEFRSSGQTCR